MHEFVRGFGGVTLTIRKTGVPDAWVCALPDGKRVIGELHTVCQIVEETMGGMRDNANRISCTRARGTL